MHQLLDIPQITVERNDDELVNNSEPEYGATKQPIPAFKIDLRAVTDSRYPNDSLSHLSRALSEEE